MEQELKNKVQEHFTNLYSIFIELEELKKTLEVEMKTAEKYFQKLEKVWEKEEDPSDELEKLYNEAEDNSAIAENDFSVIEGAVDSLDSCILEMADLLEKKTVEKLKKDIKKAKSKKKIKQLKMLLKKFIEDDTKGIYSLQMELTTDIEKKPMKIIFSWNGKKWQREGEMPYLHQEALTDWKTQKQEIIAQIWQNRKTPNLYIELEFDK